MDLPPLLDRKRGLGLAGVAALTLVQSASAGAAAFATRALFEAMHQGAAPPVAALGVLVGSGAVIAVTRIGARHLGERIGQDYARRIRTRLFEHAARMPARAVAERRMGYVSLRFVGDMTAFRNWLSLGLPRLIAVCVLVPAMLAVLWLLDPAFALAVGPVLVLSLVMITLGGLRLVPLQRRLRTRRARIAAEMAERMPLAPMLDRLGRRNRETTFLERRSDAMIRAALRHRLGVETLKALPDLATGVAAALVILVGYREALGTGAIAAALATLGLLLAPLRDFVSVWNHRAAHRVAALKARALLSRTPRNLYRRGKSLPNGPLDVLFEDVVLPSGDRLALALPGGRSTDLEVADRDADCLRDLVLGLESPRSGRVLLSGIDMTELSRGTLRRNIDCLSTQTTVLRGSLRRALLMGCESRPDDATVERAARKAGLGGLLDRLGGLDGTVPEGGRTLTRAEHAAIARTRIALARPRLIVIDLDPLGLTKDNRDMPDVRKNVTVIRLHRRIGDATGTG